MTEKRFTIFGEWHKDNVIDEIRDNTGEYVTIGRCVDLLNENEQLKYSLSAHMVDLNNYKGKCSALEEENEQLKQELYSYQLLLMDFDFKNVDELRKALEMKIIIQSNVQSYCDVLRKYGIDNAEKLDQVLFNQRVW